MALAGDVASQRALVAGAEADIPLLDQAEVDMLAALAVLTGQAAQTFTVAEDRLTGLAALSIPVPGLSSELLYRRPDVAAAEAGLAASRADVAAARAAMLPRITLTAQGGVDGGTEPSRFLYALMAGLTAPVFNRERLAGERDTAIGLRLEREADYRRVVLTALSDVERTVKAIANIDRNIAALETQAREAERALAAAEARYRVGVDDLIVSLDAQRTLYAARERLVQARGDRVAALVALYRALGGGWTAVPPTDGV